MLFKHRMSYRLTANHLTINTSMMKYFTLLKNFLYLALLLNSPLAFSQNVGVNSSGSAPDTSAGLDVSFSNKGLLIPRVALTSITDVTTITSPATSLLVYNTAIAGTAPNDVTPGYYYFNGSTWLRLSTNVTSSQWTTNGSNVYYTGGNVGIGVSNPTYKLHIDGTPNPLFLGGVQNGSTSDSVLTITNGLVKKLPQNGLLATSWGLNGNTATSSNFIGTTNRENIIFKANNTQAMLVDTLGNVAIGSTPVFNTNAYEKLLVDVGGSQASPASSYNGLVVKGYTSSYLQLNVQNKSSGPGISADVVATANNGTEDLNYIDMGINCSLNDSGKWGGPNDAYLFNKGQDLLIGTGTPSKSIQFLTGGDKEVDNERMRITGSGNVGIGHNNPSYRLHVTSSLNPLFLSGLQLVTSADTVLTVAAGVVKKALQSTVGNQSWSLSGNNVSTVQKIGTTSNRDFPFITNNVERMRISNSGNVGIGNTSPQYKLHVSSTGDPLFLSGLELAESADTILTISEGVVKKTLQSTASNQSWSLSGNDISSEMKLGTFSNFPLPFITGNTEWMRITQNGTVGIHTDAPDEAYALHVEGDILAAGTVTESDRRLKKNIQDLNYGLKEIIALQPVTYNWIDPSKTNKLQLGLIAQDARKVLPEIVNGDEEKGKLGINYVELVPVLINAIKEQQSKLDAQQKQIDELKELVQKSLSNK